MQILVVLGMKTIVLHNMFFPTGGFSAETMFVFKWSGAV